MAESNEGRLSKLFNMLRGKKDEEEEPTELREDEIREVPIKLGTVKTSIDKNKRNIRLLAYANERLEQYTRRDNLRLFNFPKCENDKLCDKFIELAHVLGVDVQQSDINIIHFLPAKSGSQPKPVIVRFNNRSVRNKLLYSKKAPLKAADCCFKGVYIQEDLTMQRSKLLHYVKEIPDVERVVTSEGRVRVTLKDDKGAGKTVNLENPDDLFKIGVDIEDTDVTKFGFQDI